MKLHMKTLAIASALVIGLGGAPLLLHFRWSSR